MSEPVFGNEKTGSIRDISMPGKQTSSPKQTDLHTEPGNCLLYTSPSPRD